MLKKSSCLYSTVNGFLLIVLAFSLLSEYREAPNATDSIIILPVMVLPTILFPGMVMPLHLFEDTDKNLLRRALEVSIALCE
jgi:hypothetical protein